MAKNPADILPPEQWRDEDILTKDGVCFRLQLETTRAVATLVRKRKLSQVRLGHRTVRFLWGQVKKEMACLEQASVFKKKGLTV